jgi:oxaloacetate decarboxylase alpha subunit
MTKIQYIDTTLRDGQQSLWALNMRINMMVPALEALDQAGFESLEFFLPNIQLKKIARDLHEDPWEWLRRGVKTARHTELRLHGGYKGGLAKIPECVSKLLIRKVVDHGITLTRTSNAWNDFDKVALEVFEMNRMGMRSVVNIIYTQSPRHDDEYYFEKFRQALKTKAYRYCFKDVGGLLTPDRVRTLLPEIMKILGPEQVLEFHCHSNNGLAPLNVVEAVNCGVRHVHVATPPLASGSSQPSVYNVARNLRLSGYTDGLDLAAIDPARDFLSMVAKEQSFSVGEPAEYDLNLYQHQVPGGMISNLRYQLRRVGMEDRIPDTLIEAGRVRADFGYPIMVTPLSQFIGTQAAINVITGARYKQVTDEVIHYALGNWGQEAVAVMDPAVRETILDRPRARSLKTEGSYEPTLKEVRKKYGERLSDEELILRTYVDADAVETARRYRYMPYRSWSIVNMIQKLSAQNQSSRKSMVVKTRDFKLELG